jgi:hypothetical protein
MALSLSSHKGNEPHKKVPSNDRIIAIVVIIASLMFLLFIGGRFWFKLVRRRQQDLQDEETLIGDDFGLMGRTVAPERQRSGSRHSMHGAAPESYSAEPTVSGYGQYSSNAEAVMMEPPPPRFTLPPSPILHIPSAPPIIPPLKPLTPLYGLHEGLASAPPSTSSSSASAGHRPRSGIFNRMPLSIAGINTAACSTWSSDDLGPTKKPRVY